LNLIVRRTAKGILKMAGWGERKKESREGIIICALWQEIKPRPRYTEAGTTRVYASRPQISMGPAGVRWQRKKER